MLKYAFAFFVSISLFLEAMIEHTVKNVSFNREAYPIFKPRKTGTIKVSDLFTLSYSLYGNPNGIPVLMLHGGPCQGCIDDFTKFFDCQKWNIIMFDQRGAPKSPPFACMEENTTQHNIDDIEKLRKHLGIDQWIICGGSWGSLLGLLYGQHYADRCLGFILTGQFLGRKADGLYLLEGMGKIQPEAYAKFISHIPKSERGNLLEACYKKVMDPNPDIHMPFAKAFIEYDLVCAYHNHTPCPEKIAKLMANQHFVLGMARAFIYYTYNNYFIDDEHVLSNMYKIAHLPAVIVHGRFDIICRPEIAYTLHRNWPNSTLWMVEASGHGSDANKVNALAEATDYFANRLKP